MPSNKPQTQTHFVVHDGVHVYGDGVSGQDLLGRNVEGDGPHVDLAVAVHARQHEEDPRPPRPARQQAAQPEDDRSLVLLHYLTTSDHSSDSKLFE